MARLVATNYTGANQFPYATTASDLFRKEDIQTLALAVDAHDHTTGKGLAITAANFPAGSISGSAIADGTITSAKIADGTIQDVDISAVGISGTKIQVGTIDRTRLAAGVFPATQVLAANQSGDGVTTSLSYVDVPGLTVSITTTGGVVEVMWIGPLHQLTSGSAFVTIMVDGVDGNVMAMAQPIAGSTNATEATVMVHQPTAGAHTYRVRLRCNGSGTANMLSSQRQSTLVVREYRP